VTYADPRVARIIQQAPEFVSRLPIIDHQGRPTFLSRPRPEQVTMLDVLCRPAVKLVLIYKPRQIGASTLSCAHTLWRTYATGHAVRTLIAAHEDDATDSLFSRTRHMYGGLPDFLQRKLHRSNRRELIFEDTQAGIRVLTAGGRGQGRSWTYNRLVAEELAFWPHAKDTWASLTSTLHDGPFTQKVVISTADGPQGLFYEQVRSAQARQRLGAAGDESTVFLFFRWMDHPTYRKLPPPTWEPTQAEYEYAQTHGLDRGATSPEEMHQLYWRHDKIYGLDGIGEARFRREYPATMEDGFMVFEGAWFDVDYLNTVLASLGAPKKGELRIYREPKETETYVIGADPSWCTGGDDAVAQVLDRRGRQCATLSMNQGGELLFAERVADLSYAYNRARVLCEANKGGAGSVVVARLGEEGVPLWREVDQKTGKAKDWITTGGRKEEAYSHARQMVNGDALTLRDVPTVQQLMLIRQDNGRIQAPDSENDDMAMALVLAEWNRRTIPSRVTPRSTPRRYSAKRNPFSAARGRI
jgi:hypothetical protein